MTQSPADLDPGALSASALTFDVDDGGAGILNSSQRMRMPLVRLKQGGNGGDRIPLQPVIHENERSPFWPRRLSLADQGPPCDSRLRVFLLDAVVRFECLYRLLILAARLEQETGGYQVRVGRLPGNATCSSTGGIASQALRTCATRCLDLAFLSN